MPDLLYLPIKDFDVLPEAKEVLKANATYSIGDTHGNAMAVIRYLYEIGLIKDLDQTTYATMLDLYKKIGQCSEPEDLTQFREHVAAMLAPKSGDSLPENVKLRFFGDMLADRGSNDILTLIVLDELKKIYQA